MRSLKQLLRSDPGRECLRRLAVGYIHLVHLTSRWRVVGDDIPHRILADGKPCIAAFWHGRLLMLPISLRRVTRAAGRPQGIAVHMLISHHGDGRLISDVLRSFDIGTIDGSTTRGGSGALRAMLRALKNGEYVSITPDAPYGPAMRLNIGIITIARLAGVPIVPMTYATSRRRILKSWDRFHLPFPFSRGVFLWGEPISLPEGLDDADIEQWRAHVEERMNALTAEADRQVGHAAVAPGTLGRNALRAARRTASERR